MDVSTAQSHLDEWLAADLAVSKGQTYSIGDRSLTRADAQTIREQIDYWTRLVNTLTARASAQSGTFAANNPGVARASWS
jgi:predicted RecB family nuclease